MNMHEWAKAQADNLAFLDAVDFKIFISKNEHDTVISVDDIKDAVADYYSKHKELLPSFLEGYVFNYVGTEELSEYLAKRYKVNSFWNTVDFYYIDNPNLS